MHSCSTNALNEISPTGARISRLGSQLFFNVSRSLLLGLTNDWTLIKNAMKQPSAVAIAAPSTSNRGKPKCPPIKR